ncbi:hypothetical protein BCU84_04425 [Shewanella sp. 10N.286.51.B7]|uniref:hypothetical protein n=1 Tax=Shewanella sp. 10N.286.51.B7 TaxID=1880836 RepID=UPI000C862504|nr:hypothetical protein [Shewanella sp. 10N.286.51.B7]PMG79992.1 hypothetical protein BCU84_04425 [Shewanella sp. 10N.286.51.B7]
MRLTLVATFALAISSQAHASIEQQLANCASHTDKLDRLMCFDALAASVNTAVATQLPAAVPTTSTEATAVATTAVAANTPTTVAPAVASVSSTQAASTAEQEFGLKKNTAEKDEQTFGLKQVSEEEDDVRLYAEVSSVSKDPYGALIVKLSNDQTWKQVGTSRYKLKAGQTIYIEKGALSSFLLGSDDRNSTMRVKRVN